MLEFFFKAIVIIPKTWLSELWKILRWRNFWTSFLRLWGFFCAKTTIFELKKRKVNVKKTVSIKFWISLKERIALIISNLKILESFDLLEISPFTKLFLIWLGLNAWQGFPQCLLSPALSIFFFGQINLADSLDLALSLNKFKQTNFVSIFFCQSSDKNLLLSKSFHILREFFSSNFFAEVAYYETSIT